jgi:peptide/nickel transport system substrate-binding protein
VQYLKTFGGLLLRKSLVLILISLAVLSFSCRRTNTEFVTVALPEKFTTFDTLTTTQSDASAERVRSIIFNTLVRKNEKFEYVGELAKDIKVSDDGKTITFSLRDGVKFHNGKEFTSADVKYTFDELFKANGYKAGAFFDTEQIKSNGPTPSATPICPREGCAPGSTPAPKTEATPQTKRVAHITSIETPDPKTVVFTVTRPALANQLLSNLVAVPIVAEGTIGQLKDQPIGTGPYKFVNFDASQNIVELAANPDYWEGAPKLLKLRLKTVTDANSLQAELQTGGVDIAPNPSNLPPDSVKALGSSSNLKVEQTDGSNIQYLVFNTQSPPLNNAKIRQAIGYAIDRQKIVSDLLFNQAAVADSVVPTQSWAFNAGTQYKYDPAKAKQLLQEAGHKNEPIVFKYSSGNTYVNQYSQVIQSSLADVGLNVQIETLEVNTIRTQLAQGQFQMYTGVWIGGNQDPIFLRDLFASSKIPGVSGATCCNRSRYVNQQVDDLVQKAIDVTATDRDQAKQLYGQVWQTVSTDMPLLPLWYPANIVIANKRIGNIKISPSGDYSFVKDITVQ